MDSEDLYSDEYYDDYDSESDYSYDDEEDDDAYAGLDYYYDDEGFAHPVRSKGKFGYDRYRDAYNYHLDPHRNDEDYSSDEEDGGYSSYSDDDSEEEEYSGFYDPHGRYGAPTSKKRVND